MNIGYARVSTTDQNPELQLDALAAAGFDQHDFEIAKSRPHLGDGGEVDRGILADRGMRATAGLDPNDTFGRQGAGAGQERRVLAGVDVVGDGGDVVMRAHRLAEPVHQRGLARADRRGDTET